MMSVTIDPSETRRPAMPAERTGRPRLRLALLSGLGILGLAGFAAVASSTLGGLAGPQYTRPNIKTAAAQSASDWPDLRDGIPALAPVKATEGPPPVDAPAPIVRAAAPVPSTLPAAVTPEAPPPKRIESVAAKPVRLPPIENAAVLPPTRPAALVPVTRNATLIAPTPNETTRSRATNGTFTALSSEREAPKHPPTALAHAKPVEAKPVAAKPVAPKPAAVAKPAPAKVAAASAPEPQAEAEPEHTEVFGLKVPSLAPAGRKLAEGVEALGNAVKSLPDRF